MLENNLFSTCVVYCELVSPIEDVLTNLAAPVVAIGDKEII